MPCPAMLKLERLIAASIYRFVSLVLLPKILVRDQGFFCFSGYNDMRISETKEKSMFV